MKRSIPGKQLFKALALTFFSIAAPLAMPAANLPEGIAATQEGLILLDSCEAAQKAPNSKAIPRSECFPASFWSSMPLAEGGRCALYGKDDSSCNGVSVYWNDVESPASAYIAYVFAIPGTTAKGTQEMEFALTAASSKTGLSSAKEDCSATLKGARQGWLKLGKVACEGKTNCFKLSVSTKSSCVRFTSVLLVPEGKPSQKRAANGDGLAFSALEPWNGGKRLKGNIFEGFSGALNLEAKGETPASLMLTAEDEEGRELFKKSLDCDAGKTFRIDLPTPGFYELNAKAVYADGGTSSAKTTAFVAGPAMNEESRMKSRFGLCCSVKGEQDYSVVAGANWDRIMVTLKDEKEFPDDGASKQALPAAPAEPRKMKAIGVFSFGLPFWAMKVGEYRRPDYGNPFFPPKDWNTLKEIVKRYCERPNKRWPSKFPEYFEIYNEPDGAFLGSDDELAKVHEVMAAAIKETRPETKTAGPCFCSIMPSQVTRSALKTGLLDHMDAFATHAYANGIPEEQFISEVRALRKLLKSSGKGEMPILITEYGWPTDGTGRGWGIAISEREQARRCARSMALMSVERIESIMYFCLYWKEATCWSILNNDMTPKPTYASFATTAKWMGGAEEETLAMASPEIHVVSYRRDGRQYAAIWTLKESFAMKLAGKARVASGMTGRPFDLKASDAIEVSPNPAFVEFDGQGFAALRNAPAEPALTASTGQGQIATGFKTLWCPPPLAAKDDAIIIPSESKPGDYIILKENGKDPIPLRIRLEAPIAIESMECKWPANEKHPLMLAEIETHMEQAESLSYALTSEIAGEMASGTVNAPARGKAKIQVELPKATFGDADKLTLKINSAKKSYDAKETRTFPLMPCVRSEGGEPDWSQAPAIKLLQGFALEEKKPVKDEDCSATAQFAYDKSALRIRISVCDNERTQTKKPAEIWSQDSIQIGIDADAEKPFSANVGGLNGHFNVYEFGSALRSDGGISSFCWSSYNPDISTESFAASLSSEIKTEGKETAYAISIPWSSLGGKMPSPGTQIGLAIVVNDADGDNGKRHGLLLFDGIAFAKNPELFGRLTLRP